MPGTSSSGSDPKYDKKTINMLSNMSIRERNKFVREHSRPKKDSSGANSTPSMGGMKGVRKDARAAAKAARKAGDKDTAKAARKLSRQADRTIQRRKARRAAK